MKLYYATGTCSLGIRIILEEIGEPYEAERLDLASQQQLGEKYVAINPKSKVPAIAKADGTVLTEFPVIAHWLAKTFPRACLLPYELEPQIRVLETLEYIVSTIHTQGFARIFRPANFNADARMAEEVRSQGRAIVEKGLAIVGANLVEKTYLHGNLSIADAALFYVEYWIDQRLQLPLPSAFGDHFAAMKNRPAVQQALQGEGIRWSSLAGT